MRQTSSDPISIEFSDDMNSTTANGGVILVLKTLAETGMLSQLGALGQGWLEGQMRCAVLLLNILGLDRVSDIDKLEDDAALCTLMRKYEPKMFDISRRKIARRFRGGRKRTFPSARSILDWLSRFHDAEAGQERIAGVAIVPEPSARLSALDAITRILVELLVNHLQLTHVTLDIDATIIGSGKREALKTYRSATGAVPGETGYQPLNVFCPELGIMLYTQMRDGNVPASLGIVEALDAALALLPAGVKTVMVRSDAAGHQEALLKYCNDPSRRPAASGAARFGEIKFVISAILSDELSNSVQSLGDDQWSVMREDEDGSPCLWGAEVGFVSAADASHKPGHLVRYVAVMKPTPNRLGAGKDEVHESGDRPSGATRVLVTNIPSPEQCPKTGRSIEYLYDTGNQRCGHGEEVHAVVKRDFAGGTMPSGKFGANAGWWKLAVTAANLMSLIRQMTLGVRWKWVRMKRVRAAVLNIPAKIVRSGRQSTLKFASDGTRLLSEAIERLNLAVLRL